MNSGVVILNYNQAELTTVLAKHINSFDNNLQVCVVDNNSTEDSKEVLKSLNEYGIKVIFNNKNSGYSAGNNIGLKYLIDKCECNVVAIANPDIWIEKPILLEAFRLSLLDKKFGVLAPMHTNEKGVYNELQHKKIPSFLEMLSYSFFITRYFSSNKNLQIQIDKTVQDVKSCSNRIFECEVIWGCLLIFRSESLEKIGYLDENIFLYYEEQVLYERMKQEGLRVGLIRDLVFEHRHDYSKSIGSVKKFAAMTKSEQYFRRRYLDLSKAQNLILDIANSYSIFEKRIINKLISLKHKNKIANW
ncbi:glycosyltransferase family 2 protein [Enterococcus sp. AZ109]|uniref:glycosyltransferase family 2 protein n=1 Tax=Enterococcus sp. AZ109 TaxID=2774634 RepID=UPI003F6859F6